MTRRVLAAAAVILVACSSLGEGNGAVSIEIFVPSPASVEVGDTITMRARLLDINGDSIAGTIRWRAQDTTLTIDSINGRLTGRIVSTGRIQAVSGSLAVPNPPLLFNIRPHADTLIIPAATESLTVQAGDSQTTALNPRVATTGGTTNVQDATLIFTMLFPADSSALLNGSLKADTVLTGSSGESVSTFRVKQHGAVRPDSAVVQVEARRPSGAVVPGSGQ
ncbi:MAG TPA: hypothetical protein VL295_09155, partial [Gemmatimonadales bacterium]|nr:hypothetical protein [Gemmatimonadales bacterium]